MGRTAGAAEEAGGPSAQLAEALQRLARLIGSRKVSAATSRAAGADLTQQEMQVVRALARLGAGPVAAVAREAEMDQAAVSRQLTRLNAKGLTQGQTNPRDRRSVQVTLTTDGTRAADELRAAGLAHLERSLAGWSDADRSQLAELLTRLVKDMAATPIAPGAPPDRAAS